MRLLTARSTIVTLVAAGIVAAAGVAAAAGIDGPAEVASVADRAPIVAGDMVSIYDVQTVDQFVVEASFQVAQQVGAAAAAGRTGSAGMVTLTRNGQLVHAAPDGYHIPMAFIALPREAVAGVVGRDVSSAVAVDRVVMNEMTAQMTGAQVGDVITLQVADKPPQTFVVAGIRPYAQVGGSDLVMTTAAADRIGVPDDTRMVIWGITSRPAIDAALAGSGLVGRKDTRVSRSWDLPDPDDTLSTPRAKLALGEPWYIPTGGDTIAMHPAWKASNLTDGRVLLNSAIPVRAQCHNRIVADLQAALSDVAAAGLGGAIDVGNTNTYGGCFNPRYSRTSGFLSRHAYAMAIDMNTTTNCQGCVPRMNCDVVRIFRRHGFAWGGNFRQPDGMHFEWVGERRDQISYPSNYCPNLVNAGTQSATVLPTLGIDVLTVGDGWSATT